MAGEDWIELKFRLADGTDIGPNNYSQSTTVASLKEKIIAQWPKDKENAPKSINDVKLINAGKILENSRTLAECRPPVDELSETALTMHVVLRPPMLDKKSDAALLYISSSSGNLQSSAFLEKLQNDPPVKNRCSCSIL